MDTLTSRDIIDLITAIQRIAVAMEQLVNVQNEMACMVEKLVVERGLAV